MNKEEIQEMREWVESYVRFGPNDGTIKITEKRLLLILDELLSVRQELWEMVQEDQDLARIHSNVEWQRNWSAAKLSKLGISVPHPEYDHDDADVETRIKNLLEGNK